MSNIEEVDAAPQPLTALTEDEKLFQSTVRKFAREQVRPYVREMDEAGVFRPEIVRQFFEMGLMGIEIPEEFGGSGLGITDAAIMMRTIAESGAGMSGAFFCLGACAGG